MNGKIVLKLSAFVALAVVAVFAGMKIATRNYTFKGSVIEPDLKAYDYSLVQADGQVYSLEEQRGKVVLMFFGYTNCPDFCPTTLGDFKKIHELLGDQASEVDFILITIDPERDSPQIIQAYAEQFHPDFYGFSGSTEELEIIWESFYIASEKEPHADDEEYLVSHTTRIVVVDKFGNFRMTFPFGLGAEAMAQDVSHLVGE